MAGNALYGLGRAGILAGTFSGASAICAMLVKTGYSVTINTDQYLDTVSTSYNNGKFTGAGNAGIANKTYTLGVLDGDDFSITATAAVVTIAIVLYVYNASDGAAALIAYIDTATGLPFTPAASQTVNITWDSGANKIFKL
jgi:hypothetical protein